MGWSEEELKNHYLAGKNGMQEKFKWLTVDYSACYPNELEKRILMQATKPEIVIVDHMGLLKSKYEDNNRNAKRFKVLPHRHLEKYEYSIFVDGNFSIKDKN